MVIGTGIVLLVAGIILVSGVIEADIPNVDDAALGWILVAAGVLAIVLSLIINAQRQRHTVVEERVARDPRVP